MSTIDLSIETRDRLRKEALESIEQAADDLKYASYPLLSSNADDPALEAFEAATARMGAFVSAYWEMRGAGPYTLGTVALLAGEYVRAPADLPIEDWGVPATVDEVDKLSAELARFREMIELRDLAVA